MMMSFSLLVVIMSLQSLSLWWLFEISAYMFCFFFLWKVMSMFASYEMVSDWFAYDCMSNLLILLTFLIIGLMISASYNSVLFVKKKLLLFSYLSFSMLFFLYVTFYSLSVINFYIFFEASLIPIFLMIMGWGYQPERLQASMYMLFYTLFASLPLLVIILLEQENFSSFLPFAQQYPVLSSNGTLSLVMSFFLIFAFLVKLPTFTVHLWLPKAHVEAPVAGSMILAGVLLKLGGFGIWRVLSKFYPDFYYSVIFIILGLVGGVVVSFICSIQIDMKALVAYSSIVHMGIMLAGLGTFTSYGFEGALCMMLGHGVVSSGLFYMVGLNYDRIGSRSLIMNKGLMIVFPAATISWFMLSVFNISAPPSLSLMSEILLTTSLLFSSVSLTIFLMMMNFMSMVYTFYLYAQSQQGKIFDSIINLMMLSVREYMVSFSHVIVALVMFLFFWLF